MTQTITIIKNNHLGEEVWRYDGEVLERSTTYVAISTVFLHPEKDEVDIGYFTFCNGDRMIETFYTDRWYNVFQVFDGESDRIKGWYCNITRPAELGMSEVSGDDLELDVIVTAERTLALVDEDEYAELALKPGEQKAVMEAVKEIRELVARRQSPFA